MSALGDDEIGLECRRRYIKLVDMLASKGCHEFAKQCAELAVKQGFWADPMQRPEHYIPGLSARPSHHPNDFPVARYLESYYAELLCELHTVTGSSEHGFHKRFCRKKEAFGTVI